MTDRIPLDLMNSDQLDALYERAEQAEAAHTEPALRYQLRAVLDPILVKYPEHNRIDEHEEILGEIITAVLRVVLHKPCDGGDECANAHTWDGQCIPVLDDIAHGPTLAEDIAADRNHDVNQEGE